MTDIFKHLLHSDGNDKIAEKAIVLAQIYRWAKISDRFPTVLSPNFNEAVLSTKTPKDAVLYFEKLNSTWQDSRVIRYLENNGYFCIHDLGDRPLGREDRGAYFSLGINFKSVADLSINWEEYFSEIQKDINQNDNCFKEVALVLVDILCRYGNHLEYTIPEEITSLMIRLANIKRNRTVLCLDELSTTVASSANNYSHEVTLFLRRTDSSPELHFDIDQLEFRLVCLLLDSPVMKHEDIISLNSSVKFDIGISAIPLSPAGGLYEKNRKYHCTLPIGLEFNDGRGLDDQIGMRLEYHLSHIKDRSILLVPENFLDSNLFGHKELRKKLVRSGVLNSIISLPFRVLGGEDYIGKNKKIAILVIDHHPTHNTNKITFIDASGNHFSKTPTSERNQLGGKVILRNYDSIVNWVTGVMPIDPVYGKQVIYQEIENNDYNLIVKNNVVTEEFLDAQNKIKGMGTVELSEVCEVISVPPLKSSLDKEEHIVNEVRISDLIRFGYVKEDLGTLPYNWQKQGSIDKVSLKKDDILLSIKGTIGKVGLVRLSCHINAIPSQSLCIIRMKKESNCITPVQIMCYLNSPIAQIWLANHTKTKGVKTISITDLRTLPVPMLKDSDKLVFEKKYEEMVEIEHKIQVLTQRFDKLNNELF